jgi:hypothetical protein
MVVKREDWVGRRFGKLVVTDLERIKGSGSVAICQCDCGNITKVQRHNLVKGTTSCGCSRRTETSGTRLYSIWRGMKSRCHCETDGSYARYGGVGITVCERWHDINNFLMDMGYPPEGTTIERRDNKKGYEPSNCYWGTWDEQANNKSTSNIIDIDGVLKTVTQWAKEANIPVSTFRNRMYRAGMTPKEALSKGSK